MCTNLLVNHTNYDNLIYRKNLVILKKLQIMHYKLKYVDILVQEKQRLKQML